MAKRISFLKRIRRETYRIFDQVLDVGNAVIEKTGVEKILIAVSGGGSLGVSTSSGPSGGNNIHYRPPNSTSSIGLGISNGGNASLFVDNQVAMPLTTPHANFIEHPPEKVNHVIADRNQALSEIYGAGYVPESGFETIAVVAIGTAAKQLVQDGIEFASTAINVWGDSHASVYSASDTHRLETLHRNQDRFEKVGQVVSHVAKNPGAIVTHYENKVQQAANSFTAAYKHGDMVGAGNAAGHILADVYTISTLGTGVVKITAKATSSAVKATSSFVKSHDFRAQMTFQYDGSRLNSGIPFDAVKLQNPVVPKSNINNIVEAQNSFPKETQRLIGAHNRYKSQLFEREGAAKSATTLEAARIELTGEQILLAIERGCEYDHISKIQQAQNGLLKHIGKLNDRLGQSNLSEIERQALQYELSEASQLLDYSEQFVPRPLPEEIINYNSVKRSDLRK